MSKLNQVQAAIAQAFAVYKEGSTAVVRSFETAIHNFWHVDRCRTENLEFFVNTAKRFPVLQRTAVALLSKQGDKALGYFDIKKNKEGVFTITNKADITKEMKVIARQNVAKFIAMEYTSLMHDKDMSFEITFDADKAAGSIRNAIFAQVKAMIAVSGDADVSVINNLIAKATADALSKESMLKAQMEGKKLADKAAEQKAKVESAGIKMLKAA